MNKINYILNILTNRIDSILRIKSKYIFLPALVASLFASPNVLADVSSLGFTMGKTNYRAAKIISSVLQDAGINKYSKGKMLKGIDSEWKVKGLRNVTLIFDSKDKLTAIIMNMDKNQFTSVIGYLSKKYSLKSKVAPFVGNKSAIFKKDNITIEVNAPHMSFNMDIIYSTKSFNENYERIKNRERQLKNKYEESQF